MVYLERGKAGLTGIRPMSFSKPKKIHARIRRYERNLRKRDARDGSGLRYLLGSLYLLLDDTEGALAHYKWFARKFHDDSGEPFHRLSWALALHRAGKQDEAAKRLRNAHSQNVYLIPAVLGIPHGQPSGLQRGANWEDEELYRPCPARISDYVVARRKSMASVRLE